MASKQGNRHAVRHGLYARESVLPWEDPAAFAALHQAIIAELNPDGPLEAEAVREVAELHWRKQRLAMGYLLPFYRDMPPPELTEAARQGLVALASHLADTAHTSPGTFIATASEMLDIVKRRAFGKDNDSKEPSMPTVSQSLDASPPNIVEQAYDPAAFELRLKIETAIDNRINKCMARLVALKEYKRLYAPKPLTAPPISAPPLAPVEQPQEPVPARPQTAPAPVKTRKWGDPE